MAHHGIHVCMCLPSCFMFVNVCTCMNACKHLSDVKLTANKNHAAVLHSSLSSNQFCMCLKLQIFTCMFVVISRHNLLQSFSLWNCIGKLWWFSLTSTAHSSVANPYAAISFLCSVFTLSLLFTLFITFIFGCILLSDMGTCRHWWKGFLG